MFLLALFGCGVPTFEGFQLLRGSNSQILSAILGFSPMFLIGSPRNAGPGQADSPHFFSGELGEEHRGRRHAVAALRRRSPGV